ncbi:PspA/IM30 family protein [Nitrincola sp. MINF-07-Sa-05]|uniref:PspA/IM30 family protein n=1 Tax=Nitrincola salilacus TaxID=3400273 RepID=UPI003918585E
MSESITRRVARLVSGSLNALVDGVENSIPASTMEQAIREIDSAIDDTRTELGQQIAQKHLASKKLMQENSRHDTLAQQIEIAVSSGRDDLAEAGIAEQIDIEARIPILENSLADCTAREKELESFIQALQAKKRDMKAELSAFEQAQKAQVASGSPGAELHDKSTERRVEKASDTFDRILEKATSVPGAGQSGRSSSQLAELEELSRHNRIAERLAALKTGKS